MGIRSQQLQDGNAVTAVLSLSWEICWVLLCMCPCVDTQLCAAHHRS